MHVNARCIGALRKKKKCSVTRYILFNYVNENFLNSNICRWEFLLKRLKKSKFCQIHEKKKRHRKHINENVPPEVLLLIPHSL